MSAVGHSRQSPCPHHWSGLLPIAAQPVRHKPRESHFANRAAEGMANHKFAARKLELERGRSNSVRQQYPNQFSSDFFCKTSSKGGSGFHGTGLAEAAALGP